MGGHHTASTHGFSRGKKEATPPKSRMPIRSFFPKLLKHEQQHTYVQSDKYTFLYIPIDNLYLVMVSSKNSNTIEDQ